MTENTTNAAPDAPVGDLQESMQNLEINDKMEGKNAPASHGNSDQISDRSQVPDCIYFMRNGVCGYGSNCRYNHPAYAGQEHLSQTDLPERVGQPDCQHFLKTRTCKYGLTCKYNHPKSKLDEGQMLLNVVGLPIRQEEKSCSYYMRTGHCKFGVACKFNHPQPAGAVHPLSGSTAYPPFGSLAPSGVPFVGGIPSWSVPRPPYVSSPQINGLPAYTPYVLPSQVIPGQQGWSTYTGTINPASSTVVHGSGHLSNSNHMPLGPGVQILFPERPDRPDCQYYMKNGSCKYGPSCKYHHPRDRITTSSMCTIGPLGYPLRPDQAVCTYYTNYGSCKYGLACKYDHPYTGYYNYTFPVPYPGPSMLYPYQSTPPVTWAPADAAMSKNSKLPGDISKSETSNNNAECLDTNLLPGDTPPQTPLTHNTPSETPQDQSD